MKRGRQKPRKAKSVDSEQVPTKYGRYLTKETLNSNLQNLFIPVNNNPVKHYHWKTY